MPKSQTQKSFIQTMLKATKMTGSGQLMDATHLIQRALLGTGSAPRAHTPGPATASPWSPAITEKHQAGPAKDIASTAPEPANFELVDELAPLSAPPEAHAPSFTRHTFSFDSEQYPYRLYVPATPHSNAEAEVALPLVVLLHGCTQNSQDFARGTAMNALAEAHQCMVLYPEQIAKSNSQRCWNWFEAGHQQYGRGEPGMIAALTQRVLAAEHHGRRADTQRVYIAGLSAGGAMATVVAALYPDLFAALGVHSGLAAGAAQDLMSAFGAMRVGAKGRGGPALPTIVLHGTADRTVHPDNGEHIIDAALSALQAEGLKLVKSCSVVGAAGQKAERTVFSAADGPSYIEHWLIDAGPHAWSGGNAAGSYTDPDGPSASEAMLRFFLQHRKS